MAVKTGSTQQNVVLYANGHPTLLATYTSRYTWIYSDLGSGADMDVTIYRPVAPAGYYIVGDYAQGNFTAPVNNSLIVSVVNQDPAYPVIAAPASWQQVWNDADSGGDYDGAIWRAVAPTGYASLGCVGTLGYDPPVIKNYACIRQDLIANGSVGNLIWSDSGSDATEDISLYLLNNVQGAFAAQANYDPYRGPAFQLAGGFPGHSS
ncbi:Vps62-related protein [Deminuibacter soli]|nr:Vps62-related protein [Deminuibacter soli]